MYKANHFNAAEQPELIAFMRAHPFVVVCGAGKDGVPVATQVPVLIEQREGRIYLAGHFMRKQDHTRVFAENPNALAIFTAAHAYISASWYADPKRVSTWNYQAVHASGSLRFTDEAELYAMLVKLTRQFEGRDDSPALVPQMDEDYLRQNMKAIIGFEIELTSLSPVFKLSQNRQESDYERVITELLKGDSDSRAVALEMKKNRDRVFGRD